MTLNFRAKRIDDVIRNSLDLGLWPQMFELLDQWMNFSKFVKCVKLFVIFSVYIHFLRVGNVSSISNFLRNVLSPSEV